MPAFSGFIGPTYGGRSAAADSERSINLFLESIESPEGATKTRRTLLSKPGLNQFAALEYTASPSVSNPVTIPPALTGYEFGSSPLGQFAFEYEGAEYVFLFAGAAGPLGTGDSKIHALRSTDSGATWTELDSADAPLIDRVYGGDYTVARDGATVWIVAVRHHDGGGFGVFDGLRVLSFNLSTNTWGSATDFASPTIGVLRNPFWVFVQLVVRGPGDYLLFYGGPSETISATAYRRCYYATFNGTAFGSPVELPSQAGVASSYTPFSACVDASGIAHFFYGADFTSGPGVNIWHQGMAANGTFGTRQQATDAVNWISSTSGTVSPAILFTQGATAMLGFVANVLAAPGFSTTDLALVYAPAGSLTPAWQTSTISTDQSLLIYPDNTDILPQAVALAYAAGYLSVIWGVSDNGNDNGNFHFYWSAAPAGTLAWSTASVAAGAPASTFSGTHSRATQVSAYPMSAGMGVVIVWCSDNDNEVAQFFSVSTGANATATAVLAQCAINGRGFAIGAAGVNNYFFEVKADGSVTGYGAALPGDTRPQMCASQTQILILSGGQGYIFDLRANSLTAITAAGFPAGAIKAGFLDGYFIVLEPNSQTFAISGLNNGTAWDALDFGDAEGEPGNITTFVVDHRQIWFLGNNHGEIYYNSGDANFPISRLEGAFMEQGCSAIDSAFQCDNTIFWKGGNRDGENIFWRANGYTPERISTYAIEALVDSFGDTSDCSGYCYQEGGHTFARWDFPSACSGRGASLLYDVGEQSWHERGWWDASLGVYRADLARCHMFVFNQHLVGDYGSGNIYVQSMDYATDAGNPIRRLRAAPDLANGGKWTFYGEFRLLMETGVGLDGGVVPGTDPQCYLQISNDGGKTWEQERPRSMGPLGSYRTTVRWTPNGRSNNRVFRWICSEPVKVVLIAADLDVTA